VTGNNKPGRVTATITDLTVPAPGLPIQIQRNYDSLNSSVSGDFGFGWNLGINVQVNISPEDDVTLTINGSAKTFYFTPPPNSIFTYWYTPLYTPEPGLYGSLVTTGDNCDGVLNHVAQTWACAINNAGNAYQPTGYQYTDPSGRVYSLGPTGAIQSVKDLNGNTLTVAATGISSSNGLSVPFVRDSSGRITQITDTLGNHYTYGYDSSGNLASVTYPGISTPAQYQYDTTHLLTKEIDQRGNTAGTTTYYPNGQLQSVTDAVGNTFQYSYNTATNTTTVTNPDGGTVVSTYDSYGMPLTVTDPLGRTTTSTYDVNHNMLTATDPLGHTIAFTYDANGFTTSRRDPLGNTSTAVNDALGSPTALTDPLGNQLTVTESGSELPLQFTDSIGQMMALAYDNYGNIIAATDPSGAKSTFSYDSLGDKLTLTDALNRVTTATYDALGNLLSDKDPRGNTWYYSYDPLSRLIQSVDPTGKITRFAFDANGNLISSTDALQRQITYAYDSANRPTQTTFPDGTIFSTTYDWRGNPLRETDQSGNVTSYMYDLAGQLQSVTSGLGTPAASTTSFTYDAAGRKLTAADARGNVTAYAYDAAGRMVSVTAPAGTTQLAYDADSRLTSLTDANGHITQYTCDVRGRRTMVSYADGTTTASTYDGTGRVLNATDQNGDATSFGYDAAGQLQAITDPLGHQSSYGYDASGNQITGTDANQHTTTDSFDTLNQFVGRTWPGGGAASSTTYDAVGNPVSVMDNNGKTTTFTYDSLNRLLQETPDPSFNEPSVVFTYTRTGRRATMADASGTTTYTYDALDRLVSKATPEGTLTYSYDAQNNLLSMQSSNPNGASVSYSYDTMNRLSTVTDNRLPAGQNTTTYSYDPVSNLVTAMYPNQSQQTLSYDQLNRVSQSSAPSRSYSYRRSATGQIVSAAESSGRNVSYSYDSALRLVNETISADPAGKNGTLGYSLDPVTNRLSLSSTVGALAAQSLTYNSNDQAAPDAYDSNGNLLASGSNSYVWDFVARLLSANQAAVQMVYDGDGNRVAKTTASGTTAYLVDDLNPTGYAQVVEELSGGVVQRVYTYGVNRLSESQILSGAWTPSFYGYDGEGHVRYLTGVSGAVTDTYDYDAFGNLINSSGSTPNLYRYRGEQFDQDLGLYYLRARWYNPVTGRLLSRDPIDTGNKYTYAGADPANLVDPSGLQSIDSDLQTAEANKATQIFIPQRSILFRVGVGAALGTVSAAITAEIICAIEHSTSAAEAANGLNSVSGWEPGCYVEPVPQAPFEPPAPEPSRPVKPTPRPRRVPPVTPTPPKPPSPCPDPEPVYEFSETDPRFPIVAAHIAGAIRRGYPDDLIHVDPATATLNRSQLLSQLPAAGPSGSGLSWDEYPFASGRTFIGIARTSQWPPQSANDVSVKRVPSSQNYSQGGTLGSFYRTSNVGFGCRYKVLPLP
jgi:RHS repeat-associated protein